jgi:hypothetical protein
MSYPDPNHRRSETHQSIPLQDLSRPPDDYTHDAPPAHRHTLSDRGRDLLRQTGSIATGHHGASQYAPIADTSPSPTRLPQLNTNNVPARGGLRHVEESQVESPIDAGAFQSAIGFGLDMSFQGDTSPPLSPLSPVIPSTETFDDPHRHYNQDPYAQRATSEDHGYFSLSYNDSAPLTDPRHLQPISGAAASISPGSQDRSSFQSVHFLSPGDASPMATHGGDIEAAAGDFRSSRGRNRSLSPGQLGSSLHRAGTIMRNMSQRVVNVSNDSEVAERTISRKSSQHDSHIVLPPSFTTDYHADGPSSPLTPTPAEKPPSPIIRSRQPSAQWQRPQNPLRGKSLGIFPPNSKLRMKLCDLLVHPATEPFLLLLIVVQTVLLAVDASNKTAYNPGHAKEKYQPVDYALLGLFTVYTIEAIIRIIVSGFIINPVEYSTMNRQVGLREAMIMKANHIFGDPQRRQPQKGSDTDNDPNLGPEQPSVLRAFTTAQMNPNVGPSDPRERQRVRLAHRAYLRHSFNRTDFVAIVAFWISFVLNILNIRKAQAIPVFQMLSCLRIIRLLNLTSGTSVSFPSSRARSCLISILGHSQKSEKGCALASQRIVSDWLLLASLLHCRRAKLQVEYEAQLCMA